MRALKLVAHFGQHARFADARVARDAHDLAGAGCGELEACADDRELQCTSDKGTACTLGYAAAVHREALDRPDCRHPGDGVAERRRDDFSLDQAMTCVTRGHDAGRRGIAQTRGELRGAAERGVGLLAIREAADDDLAGVHGEPQWRRRDGADLERGEHCAAGVILERNGCAEQCREAVAAQLTDASAVAIDNSASRAEEGMHRFVHLFSAQRRGVCVGIGERAIEHADLLVFAARGSRLPRDRGLRRCRRRRFVRGRCERRDEAVTLPVQRAHDG